LLLAASLFPLVSMSVSFSCWLVCLCACSVAVLLNWWTWSSFLVYMGSAALSVANLLTSRCTEEIDQMTLDINARRWPVLSLDGISWLCCGNFPCLKLVLMTNYMGVQPLCFAWQKKKTLKSWPQRRFVMYLFFGSCLFFFTI
jgi:hypothetical protein